MTEFNPFLACIGELIRPKKFTKSADKVALDRLIEVLEKDATEEPFGESRFEIL